MFGLDVVEVPRAQIDQWIADARSFEDEVVALVVEEQEREAKARAAEQAEADKTWPAYRDWFGWPE
jgi:hypothetical protein